MANDPHRTIDTPSLRYWVHLVAPGWDVIGGGEPALPGVSIGHNRRGAWGFTIFPIDQEDLYVYETDPADPVRYRYQGGWESMRVERESIAVKGRGAVEVELKFTRHGPVIFEDRAGRIGPTPSAPPGSSRARRPTWPASGSTRPRAGPSSREAAGYFRTPSENLVWADVDGHIGWQAVGLAPIRKGWDGLLPVPGDGRFEWDGFLTPADLPSEVDPPRGWFASANQDNLPPGYPFAVGFQWAEPFRFERIVEVLAPDRRLDVADMTRLQQDELLAARPVAGAACSSKLRPAGDQARDGARSGWRSWDFVLDRDSVPAAIYVDLGEGGEGGRLGAGRPAARPARSFPVRHLPTRADDRAG